MESRIWDQNTKYCYPGRPEPPYMGSGTHQAGSTREPFGQILTKTPWGGSLGDAKQALERPRRIQKAGVIPKNLLLFSGIELLQFHQVIQWLGHAFDVGPV
jgi:hypothetical protein